MSAYCSYCIYFKNDECRNVNNIKIVDTWYKPKYILINKPSKLNKRNNCKWFVKCSVSEISIKIVAGVDTDVKLDSLHKPLQDLGLKIVEIKDDNND